jgi:hypothetical protein
VLVLFNLELAPALRVEHVQNHFGTRGLSRTFRASGFLRLFSFERLDLRDFGFFTFWRGALVPMDQFLDFAPGRGFTLALFSMIPTTRIPEGCMVHGVDDLCELVRLVALTVVTLCQDRASRFWGEEGGGAGTRQALMASLTASHTALCCPDPTVRSRIWCLLPINHDASHLSRSSTCRGRPLIHHL